MERFLELLPWFLPPLLGAFIGYVTNSIAIAMIFRPHKKYKFLGITVPFTPGIIPKQRFELSQSIGKMVSRELLTEDAVRKQTGSPGFREGMLRGIESSTEQLFSAPLGELLNRREGSARNLIDGPAGEESLLSLTGKSFVEGEGFPLLIKEAVSKALAYVAGIPVNRFFPNPESRQSAVTKILEILSSPELSEKVKTWVCQWLSGQRDKNTPLSLLVSEKDLARLVSLLDTLYPGIRGKLFEYLDKKEVRKDLEKRGRKLLRAALDRFNSFQRFFIMAGQFDRNLEENMGALVSDMIKALQETADKEETLELLKNKSFDKLNQFRETGIGEICERFPRLEEKICTVIESFFRFLKRPGVGEAITSGLGGLDRYQGETLGSLAESLFKIQVRDWESGISSFILDRRKTGGLGESLSPFVEGFIQKNAELTLGSFLGFTQEKKSNLDLLLCNILIELINKKIPEILESVNIQELVVDKIDSLDIGKMEGLILEVVSKQLKWINIFGGILGAVIGMSQVILRILGF